MFATEWWMDKKIKEKLILRKLDFLLSLSLLTKTNEIEKLIKDLINRYQVEHSLKNLWSIWWPNLKWQT